ncbi:glutamate--tRNA ligase [Thiohalobacter sp. IOR34]|uniref:glutamate--tRNA ligase n=1 Tax=Thiohalobacter sp. IOR34 TaxID=3057176 RepID=UPI0025B11F37|nr:glutamate--tRNA ligase [Thiohalobacter sp. IOR34]WJW74502.1 glutamate--tRNA ligase [Thiohalobacter sp. IOR34]
MSAAETKTRFAPSPTGELHLGNLRTALFNLLLARHEAGRFLLRIEDSDPERCRSEYAEALQADLRWLGLDWDEGPGVEGGHGPYFQSQRAEVYARFFTTLIEADLAYPCFCSEQELAVARTTQLNAGRPPRYPGTCARLTPAQREARLAEGRQPTLRFRVPAGEVVEFEDMVRGRQRFPSDDIGDFIIRRADGSAAFFFGNAVDDALMGVTHVLRGEDHLSNTPRQLLLLQALGLPAPQYGHIALIVGEDGAPLSKRHGSQSLRALRESGFLPAALLNHLARLGHTYEGDPGFMTLEQLATGFSVARLGRAPARHDPRQLLHWQKEAIAHAGDAELWDWLQGRRFADGGSIEERVPADQALAFVHAIRDNIELPVDAYVWAGDLFAETEHWDPDAKQVIRDAGAAFYRTALDCLETAADDFRAFGRALGKAASVKGKGLFMPLRAALTGELLDPERGGIWRNGPELGRLWPLLGRPRIERRLRAALALCES